MGFTMSTGQKEISVDEDLPNFFETVLYSSAQELVAEYDNMMNNYLFENTDPDSVANLRHLFMPIKAMMRTPWYNILSNPVYVEQFNYLGAQIFEREKLIQDGWKDERKGDKGSKHYNQLKEQCKRLRFEQSDMVMVLLNLSYIPDDVIKKIDFDAGWSLRFKQNMIDY